MTRPPKAVAADLDRSIQRQKPGAKEKGHRRLTPDEQSEAFDRMWELVDEFRDVAPQAHHSWLKEVSKRGLQSSKPKAHLD